MENINIEDVLTRIESILKIRKETKKALAESTGIRYQSLIDWKLRGTIPAADILYRISKHLGVTMEYLLEGGETLPDDIAIAVSYLNEIPEENRKSIIAMIKSQYDFYNPNK